MSSDSSIEELAKNLSNASPAERVVIIRRHPETLSAEMDSFLAAMVLRQKTAGAQEHFTGLRDFLKKVRTQGLDRLGDELSKGKEQVANPVLIRLLQRLFSAKDLEEKKHIILQNPVLLTQEVNALLTAGDERTNEVMQQYRHLLELCRTVGIEEAFIQQDREQQRSHRLKKSIKLIFELIGTDNQRVQEKILREHPEILNKEMENLLRAYIQQFSTDSREFKALFNCAQLLKDCREKGIDIVFDKPPEQADGVELLEQEFRELSNQDEMDAQTYQKIIDTCSSLLAAPQIQQDPLKSALYRYQLVYAKRRMPNNDPNQAVAMLEESILTLDLKIHPKLYGAIVIALANQLVELTTGDMETNQKRALLHCLNAVKGINPEQDPATYGELKGTIGNLLIEFSGANTRTNIENALLNLEDGLVYCNEQVDERLYASLQLAVGIAYQRRQNGTITSNNRKALQHYEEALRVQRANDNISECIPILVNMSIAWRNLADELEDQIDPIEKAIDCLHTALGLIDGNTDPVRMANTTVNLGNLYADLPKTHPFSKEGKAEQFFLQSINLLSPEENPEEFARAMVALAKYYFDRELWEPAARAYKMAIESKERVYKMHYFRTGRGKVLKNITGLYDEMAYVLVKLNRLAEALEIAEQGRSRFVREQMLLRATRPENIPDKIWTEYSHAAYSLCISEWEEDHQPSSDDRPEWLINATKALEAAIEQVRKYDDSFCRQISANRVAGQVSNSATAILVMCMTDRGSIGLLRYNSDQLSCIDFPDFKNKTLRKILWGNPPADAEFLSTGWLGSYLDQINKFAQPFPESWSQEFGEMLSALGAGIAGPLAAGLPAGIEHLICILPGELALLPLHAAPINNEGDTILWERLVISYAPSLSLLNWAENKWSGPATPSLHAAINPTDDPNLPFARLEEDFIRPYFPTAVFYEGAEATKDHIGAALSEAAIVHLACHARFDWRSPRDSGILLTDGIITLDQILLGEIDIEEIEPGGATIVRQIRPRTPMMVTLSACETAMIDFLEGSSNEFIGIPIGFLLTGFPNVVSTLWSVSDISSALFIGEFYAKLSEGVSIATALRDAALWLREVTAKELSDSFLIKMKQSEATHYERMSAAWRRFVSIDPDQKPFSHPFHYAAFTANGSAYNKVFHQAGKI